MRGRNCDNFLNQQDILPTIFQFNIIKFNNACLLARSFANQIDLDILQIYGHQDNLTPGKLRQDEKGTNPNILKMKSHKYHSENKKNK